DSRLGDSARVNILGAVWTPAGQLLVTRPGGQPGPSSLPTASATASGSGPAASTDVWLMSTMGTPIRMVAPGGNFPAAAPSGGLFSVWRQADGNHANLEVRDLQGNLISTAATVEGVTGFNWSAKGDLAFTIQRENGTDLYVLTEGRVSKIASSANGQTWSDLNWAPDASSLLFAARPAGGNSMSSVLMLINRDGSNPTQFGPQREYSAPQWSPAGDLVLFTRRDDAVRYA